AGCSGRVARMMAVCCSSVRAITFGPARPVASEDANLAARAIKLQGAGQRPIASRTLPKPAMGKRSVSKRPWMLGYLHPPGRPSPFEGKGVFGAGEGPKNHPMLWFVHR